MKKKNLDRPRQALDDKISFKDGLEIVKSIQKKQESTDWEKQFDEDFPLDTVFWEKLATRRNEIKCVIRSLLSTQKQEVAGEIIKEIEGTKINNPVVQHNSYGEGFDTGFNEAVDGIIDLLKKYGV